MAFRAVMADNPTRAAGAQVPTLDGRDIAERLREQATRCRRLAAGVTDRVVIRKLLDLAVEFEERADALEARERCPP